MFLFIYLFLPVLGLHFCLGFSLVVASRGYSLLPCMGFSLWGLLIVVASLVERGLSVCGLQ